MLLSDLPIGTKVADVNSKYNNKVITWTIASKNHYGSNEITLISDVLFKKSMDAKEPNQSNSRASYGNNHYSVSNLHQWLNSKKTSWYSPMHSLDAPPITENVIGTEYESEKGFLTNFSNNFLAKVKNTTFKTALHSLDGTGLETTVAKFFVPSCAEVGFGNENGLSEGKIFSLFSDSSNLKATFEGSAIGYYLRTPATTNNEYDYRIVRDTGSKYTNTACNAKVGTRVVCNINSNIEVENIGSYYKLKLLNYLDETESLSNTLNELENKKNALNQLRNDLNDYLKNKSVETSISDSLSVLINKINDIPTKRWARGKFEASDSIVNLQFTPSLVVCFYNQDSWYHGIAITIKAGEYSDINFSYKAYRSNGTYYANTYKAITINTLGFSVEGLSNNNWIAIE